MDFYLINPDHGRKIAYAEAEAKADIVNGWKLVTKDEYYPTDKKEDVKAVENKLVSEASEKDVKDSSKSGKKRGRKPGLVNVNSTNVN